MSYTYYANAENLSAKIDFNERLTLPANICCIKNVSINTNVLGSKVISTPLKTINLLIAGWVCIDVSYTSSKNNECVNNASFKVSFSVNIPLSKNAQCCNDVFSITSSIENMCTNYCGCKNILQKFTLFLFAKKTGSISPDPPTPSMEKLPNVIIIKDSFSKNIVSKIEFNSSSKKLIVTYTDVIPNPSIVNEQYFLLTLKTIDGNIKISSFISTNTTAINFANMLNNFNFQYNDILELKYLTPSAITVTNFPRKAQDYIPNTPTDYFQITPMGLKPYIPPVPPPSLKKLPNKIIVNNNAIIKKPVATIEFNSDSKRFIVASTGAIADNAAGSILYFSLKLKDSTNRFIKDKSAIISNENANTFARELNNSHFEYGDILELHYLIPINITITNFPTTPQNYTPTKKTELYKITPKGLETYIPPPPPEPKKLPNKIIINDNLSPNKPVATIEFNIDDKNLIVTSTGRLPSGSTSTLSYFSLKLKDSSNKLIKDRSTIIISENANNFAVALNNKPFEYGDILELDYFAPRNITITNFPTAPQNYIPNKNKEFYRITPRGLEAYNAPTPPPPPEPKKLPNKIIIANNSIPKKTVATIEFNTDNEGLIITSTGLKPSPFPSSDIYFSLKLKDSNNQRIKESSIILYGETADSFVAALNNKSFQYGDILELNYLTPKNITITNFPTAPQNYIPNKNKEFYRITPKGLEAYNPPPPPPEPNKLPNKIIVNNNFLPSKPVAIIEFNTDNERLIITSTGLTPSPFSSSTIYFSLKLKDSNNQRIKESSTIIYNQTADSFVANLNNKAFKYGDILELYYLTPTNITITNFPTAPQNHIPNKDKEFYKITPRGLEAYTPPTEPNKLPNKIIINNNLLPTEIVATLEFNTDNKRLIVTSTGAKPDIFLGNNIYFSLKLKDSNNQNTKESSTIISDLTADNFVSTLNNKSFEYDDILELEYRIPKNITITNFPDTPQTHIPTIKKELYRITPLGLKTYNPKPPEPNKLPNKIIINDNSLTNKQTVATIEFNTDNEALIVTSTGIIPIPFSNSHMYFSLKLKDNNNNIVKDSSIIRLNQNANNFASTLNNVDFQYDDILELDYFDPNNITITNFPTSPSNYIPTNPKEFYRITSLGLQPYTPPEPNKLPNKILINSNGTPKQKVATIEFNTDTKRLIVVATKIIPDPTLGTSVYFSLKLKDRNNQSIKESSTILANENDNNFASDLNTVNFQYDDILELDYLILTNINITNFPNIGQTHIPNMQKEYYRITPNGLEAYTPPPPELLPTTFILKSFDVTKEIATISFDKTNKKFLATSTGESFNAPSIDEDNSINLDIVSNGSEIFSKEISRLENADNFVEELNTQNFNYGDIMIFGYPKPPLVTLNDYPNPRDVYEMKVPEKQSFIITENGVTPNILPNEIILKNNDDDTVAFIQFDKGTKKFISYNTGNLTNANGGANYFILTVFEPNGTTKIKSSTIPGNNGGDDFVTDFNGINFEFSYIIRLQYQERTKVIITNFPNTSTPEYNPKGNNQWFIITETGLIDFTPPPVLLNNQIMFRSQNNASNAATVSFDIASNKLKVISDGSMVEAFDNFTFTLKNNAGRIIKTSSIPAGQDANTFSSALNDEYFNFGDTIEIDSFDRSRALISNFPISLNTYFMALNKESFTIEPNGLKFSPISALFNAQILTNIVTILANTENDIIASVYLDVSNNRLIAYSSGKSVVSTTGNVEYFAFVLKDSSDTLKVEAVINGNEDASNFAMKLNNMSFSFDDVLTMRHNENI